MIGLTNRQSATYEDQWGYSLVRCELDAAYFHLYDIERDEVDSAMETFPIVRRKNEQKYGEYRLRLVPSPTDKATAHEWRMEAKVETPFALSTRKIYYIVVASIYYFTSVSSMHSIAFLGDRHYNTPALHEDCAQADRLLVATRYGCYLHTDDDLEVRRVFYKVRYITMKNFHEHFKGIFEGHGQVPIKGLLATQRFALGAIFVYQLALLYRFEHDLELYFDLKAFLKAA